ncbi:TraR/DksA C4-type zinc finger protein [Rossellomorea aquimaris]|nr:TraR/DksA C4-type zinc finger protein [Rossellomorea aquimaris]MCA1056789.1 TraR/DksA C4-type zinc finger protein [Rossellomorea aquimaris]
MLTNQQQETLKRELLQQQSQLKEHLHQDLDSLHHTNERDNAGELSLYDNHPADMGTELYEREKDFAIDDHAKIELNKINRALQAMQEGTYGQCKECGKEIPFERLEVLPTTLFCTEHSPEQSKAGDRPVEEDVLQPPIDNEFRHQSDGNVRDYDDSFQEVARYGTSETPSDFEGDYEDYGELYQGEDHSEGFPEDYESFAATDIEGSDRKTYPSKKHDDYEEMLEANHMESTIGDIPYKDGDSYINNNDKKKKD